MHNAETAPEGYQRALALLRKCASEYGFLATPSDRMNYHRIWGRDGAILCLAALMTGDEELIATARATLQTLADHQGPHGEIPSNLDASSDRVTYGTTAGRVDSGLWFTIACGEYWARTGDDAFLESLLPCMRRIRFLMGAWQFNNRGLLYVPLTGDWADEYLHHGYVLYDQLLYLQAQRTWSRMHLEIEGKSDEALEQSCERLHHLIRDNYWFGSDGREPRCLYEKRLYEQGLKAAEHSRDRHWMSSFSPSGYAYRFDAFANILVSLLDVADDEQRARVDRFIDDKLLDERLPLVPAFYPVIKPRDEDWKELHVMFTYTFKNDPFEFQNGGLWPMINGFYAADAAQRGRPERARMYLDAVHRANAMEMDGESWSFPEYLHGRKLVPGGTKELGWSAAGAVIAQHALRGDRVFLIPGGPG